MRVQASHGDQGPQLPLTKGSEKKTGINSFLAMSNKKICKNAHRMARLTGARRFLTLLGLPALSLADLASKLRGGGVAEADAGYDACTTCYRAGGPG